MLRGALAATCCALVAGCAGAGGAYDGGSAGYGRRDERQVIGSYADVRAIGVSRRYVFAATPSGIAVYDRVFNAWQPPLTQQSGFSAGDQVTFMAGDPVEDALWIGVPGALIVYRPGTEQVQRAIVPGVPDFIAFDRSGNGDAIVRASGLWSRVTRVGLTTPLPAPPAASSLLLPATLQDVYERYPNLRGSTALLLRDQKADRALRNIPVVSGSISPERASEVWLGTAGDGLYRVDPTFQQATALRYGPIEAGLGALAISADGVWMAGLGTSQFRAGLSFASNDLQRWRWIDGSINVPMLGLRTNAMVQRGSRLWVATERGVIRARLDGSDDLMAWTALDGLASDRVFAVAARDNGAWAGTAAGLVFVSDSLPLRNSRTRGIGTRLMDNVSIFALQPVGDTLWIGTSAGLVALPGAGMASAPGGAAPALSRPVGADPALRQPIRSLAWSDSVLLIATDNAVLRLAPRGGVEPERVLALDVRQVGQLTRVAIDERSMVVSGTDGVIVLSRRDNAVRTLQVPTDLPGAALDIALSRDWLWVATPSGLARFRRTGDGGLP